MAGKAGNPSSQQVNDAQHLDNLTSLQQPSAAEQSPLSQGGEIKGDAPVTNAPTPTPDSPSLFNDPKNPNNKVVEVDPELTGDETEETSSEANSAEVGGGGSEELGGFKAPNLNPNLTVQANGEGGEGDAAADATPTGNNSGGNSRNNQGTAGGGGGIPRVGKAPAEAPAAAQPNSAPPANSSSSAAEAQGRPTEAPVSSTAQSILNSVTPQAQFIPKVAPVDTLNPTVTVAIADANLNDGDNSSLVTFTFSEEPSDFALTDLTVVGGQVTNLVQDTLDPTVYTATFTATNGFSGTGSVTVNLASYTDAAGNTGATGNDTVVIDTLNPTVTVAIADANLNDGDNSSLVTFTFSEEPSDFALTDLTVVGGQVTNLVQDTLDPTVYTATFTATNGFSGTGSVTVNLASYTDAAGNTGATGNDTVVIDTLNPTVTVAIADANLNDGDNSSLVTFTFSEEPSDFALTDLTVVGGQVTNLVQDTLDPTVYTATFTATNGFSGTGSVTVNLASYTDAAGNTGATGNDTVVIDTLNPTVTVAIADANLNDGDNSSLVTFTFSEEPSDFALTDLTVVGGQVTNLVQDTLDPTVYTATFTATNGFSGTGSVTVNLASYTDAAGNTGATGNDTVVIDTLNPTVTVAIADANLNDGDNSSLVTFTFSEEPSDFALTDLTVVGGQVTNLVQDTLDPTVYTATFTATNGFSGTGSVTVNLASYTDAAGNTGATGNDTVVIDTLNPTVTVAIADANLNDGDNSSLVTFTFSEEPSDFALTDLTVVGGQVTNLVQDTLDPTVYTATFTATNGFSGTGSVTVNLASYTDAAGNTGATGNDTVVIDTLNPTVTVAIADANLNDGDNSSLVTFTFSEEPSDFALTDLTVVGGQVTNLVQDTLDPTVYTATFTATNGFSGTGSVTVNLASYTDAAGNTGATGNDTVVIDTLNPTVTVAIADANLNDGDNSSLVTFTFSEEPSDFALTDLTVVGGQVTNLVQDTLDPTVYTATFTATNGFSGTGSVTVNLASYTDAAGNTGATGNDTVVIDTLNPTVTSVAIASASGSANSTLNVGDVVTVTVAMSEAVTVTGTPQLALNIGGTTVQANYASGSGTDTLSFTYTVQAGQTDANGIAIAANSLALNSGTIADVAGNAATLTHSLVADNSGYLVDTTAPTVTSVAIASASGSANSTLNVGDVVTVTVAMSEAVTVTGTPQLALNIGGTTVQANYASGSGTDTLSFTYTVQAGQTDANGIAIAANSLALNSGTIADVAGNAATLTHSLVADNSGYLVDTTAPTVTSVAIASASGSANSTLNVGDVVTVTVAMSEAVTVTGTPQLALNIGGTTVQANYASGSGTDTLSFTYTVQAGQTDANGIAIAANSLALNSGTIADVAGNAATLTHSLVADNSGYLVDTTAPTVTSVAIASASGSANSTLNVGDVVTVTVAMSEAVTVTGTPQLALNIGGTTVQANYASGSGTDTLSFTYTVQAGQTDANGIAIAANSLALNSGTIADVAGNAATLTHSLVADNSGYLVDTTAPTVTSVAIASASGSANSTLNVGDVVTVTVAMSEAVTVTGTPQLALNIGGTTVQANYASGSGTDTLSFTYTVQAGQTDANGIAIAANSLALNSGTIADVAGNAATLTHSLVADNSGYLVDTTAPTFTSSVDASVDENIPANRIVYTASSTDASSVTYSLKSGDDSASFAINPSTGKVSINSIPDWETKASYTFTVIATDAAGNSTENLVTLSINDLNEINGTGSNNTLNGTSNRDYIDGKGNNDTITGGAGGDVLVGGTGTDIFVIVNASDSFATIGGGDDLGTIAGYDIIRDFTIGSETLRLPGSLSAASAASNTGGVDGTNSALTISGAQVSSHSITNGIITFDDAASYSSALTIDSVSKVAAVVQYLQSNNLGGANKLVAFNAIIDGVTHTYIYEQVSTLVPGTNSSNSLLVDLEGITPITSLTTLLGSRITPIAIDLNGDGIQYQSLAAGISHDYGSTGQALGTAWISANDGLLAQKLENGNLNITFSTQAGETDLEGLAKVYDTNQDKVFDAKDAGFNEFGVWQDADSDGVVDAGEFISLVDRGILSLSLTSDGVIRTVAGGDVLIYGQTTFTMTDGSTSIAEDVGFAVSDVAPADGNGVQDIYQVTSVAESSLAIDNFNVDEGDYVDLSAILNPAASVQSLISIDPDGSTGPHSTITVNIGGVEYEVATLYGKEIGVADALGAHPNAASLTDSLNGASWTDVVDVSSEFGGPASISATGGALTNSYSNEAGDWTVQIKSGTATVDANNKQITFSSDQADNQAVITTADGTSHEITNVDRIMWH